MRVRETISSLLRRWYILVLGLLLTAGMCWVVQDRVPVAYEAKGSQVLMPPSATVGSDGNPYLYLGGMSQALDVLVRRVMADEAVKPVLESFPDTTYSVEADRSTTGSILVVSASGSTPEGALGVLRAALDKVPEELKGMQDELTIADKVRINIRTVVVDGQANVNNQAQLRLMLLAAGAGIAGTILVTAMMDDFLTRRKKPRHMQGEKRTTPVHGDSDGEDGGMPSREAVAPYPAVTASRSNTMRSKSRAGSGASS